MCPPTPLCYTYYAYADSFPDFYSMTLYLFTIKMNCFPLSNYSSEVSPPLQATTCRDFPSEYFNQPHG